MTTHFFYVNHTRPECHAGDKRLMQHVTQSLSLYLGLVFLDTSYAVQIIPVALEGLANWTVHKSSQPRPKSQLRSAKGI